MKMRSLIVCIIFTFASNIYTQTPYIDSLKIAAAKTDTLKLKANLYCDIAWYSVPFDYDQTEAYLDSAKSLSDEINYPYGIITSRFFYAVYLENFTYNDSIIGITDEVLGLMDKYKDSFDLNYWENYRKEVLQVKARNLVSTTRISEASEIYYELIENLPNYQDTTSVTYKAALVEMYRNLGLLFYSTNPQLSLDYFKMSISLNEKIGGNQSPQYNGLYHALSKLKVPADTLFNVLDSAIYYGLELDDQWWTMEAYTYYCWLGAKENHSESMNYCNKADSLNNFFQNRLTTSEIHNGRAIYYDKSGQIQQAIQNYEKALEFMPEDQVMDYGLKLTYDAFNFYRRIGNDKRSAEIADLYINFVNEYYETNMKTSFFEAEAKYQTSEKEKQLVQKELELSEQKSEQNRIIGGGVIMLLIVGGIGLWYYQRQSSKKKLAELALENEKMERLKLEELDELKTQFFTNVSHELKTPLTLILGPLSNTIEQSNDHQVKSNLLLAYNNAERLNDLINETLDLAKIEKGKMQINKKARPIAKDLIRSFLSFSSLAEMRDIQLEGHVHFSEDHYINCDIDKIEKIINNLVSNAIKFSENESRVIMNASMDDALVVKITDYGKGIPVNEQELIFNRFYQAKHNQYGSYGGTGIGLAFSKEIAEMLGGNLSVESKEGEGSTFTLKIPVEYVPQPEILEEEEWGPDNYTEYQAILINGERPKVLIVEDNKEMQQYLKSLLEEQYQCDFASDGFEAIRKVQSERYHLISSDVMMPNMDGFRLKERINSLPDYKNIPFIFLTARSLEEDKISGLRLGVDDYITKPFNKNEYQIRIHNLLQNHKARMMAEQDYTLDEKVTESVDTQLLKEAESIILENINDPGFKVTELADKLHYSQRQVARIIKQLTGLTPVNFILELRLQKAYLMIRSRKYRSVSEVRYSVGIESASYFTRKFKERFGVSPSEV